MAIIGTRLVHFRTAMKASLSSAVLADTADQQGAICHRHSAKGGFTLVELITVIGILSVLAAIAIQQYALYRAASYDARAMHDIGNAAVAQEAHYANAHTYASFSATGPAVLAVPGLVVSDTVTLTSAAADGSYQITSISSRGTGRLFTYDSETDTIRGD